VQLAQLQFHCGKPPPAPEPRILIFMSDAPGAPTLRINGSGGRFIVALAVGDIHRDFEAESQVGIGGGDPMHGCLLENACE
jgi:hypothetical protein